VRKQLEHNARRVGHRLEVHFGGPMRTRVIMLLAGVLALSSADTATVGASATQLRAALHIDNTDIGLLVAVNSAVAAVFSLPFGFIADRFKRTRLLSASVFLWGVTMLFSATAGSFDRLLLTRLALGFVTAASGPVVASLIGDYFPSSERGRIYGFVLTGELVGAGIGFAITGDIASLSWRLAFVFLAIPTFVLARLLLRLPEPVRGGRSPLMPDEPPDTVAPPPPGDPYERGLYLPDPYGPNPPLPDPYAPSRAPFDQDGANPVIADHDATESFAHAHRREAPDSDDPDHIGPQTTDAQRLARDRGVEHDAERAEALGGRLGLIKTIRLLLSIKTNTVLIIASAFGYFYLSGVETFAVEFAKDQYGVNQALANLLLLILGAGAIIGVLVSGPLSDRLLRRGRLNARIGTTAIMATIATVFFIPALITRNVTTALPYLTVAAFGLAAQNPPIDAARLDIVPAQLWGRAEGLRSALRTAAQSLAPLCFGGLSDLAGGHRSGLQLAFLVMLLPLGANAFLLFRAMRTYPSDVATAAAVRIQPLRPEPRRRRH
jgi:MFS family permease